VLLDDEDTVRSAYHCFRRHERPDQSMHVGARRVAAEFKDFRWSHGLQKAPESMCDQVVLHAASQSDPAHACEYRHSRQVQTVDAGVTTRSVESPVAIDPLDA